jgi:protoporphyrinogen oxidase
LRWFSSASKKKHWKKISTVSVFSAEFRAAKILGTIWNSAVFENRAPDGYHLLTTFVGGARNAELFEKSDEELFEIVLKN